MNHICPKCGSVNIQSLSTGRKTIGILGAAIGAINGARTGAKSGFFWAASNVVMGAISGAIKGGTTGIALGNLIDNEILDNFNCSSCRHYFSIPSKA